MLYSLITQTNTQLNMTTTLNYQWAFSLIHYFSLYGVTHAVISPGSRSTPLALACEQHPNINTWIQIDERSAGFFALGLAQQKHQPVILICTSGSALANWFPAVVEANHSYTPLLLLSADRPTELQNCGANQTIDQQFLFGSHVRDFIALKHADNKLLNSPYLQHISRQAFQYAISPKPGAVHINIPFREPLLPSSQNSQTLNKTIQHLSQKIMDKSISIDPNKLLSPPICTSPLQSAVDILNSGHGFIICGLLNQQEQEGFKQAVLLLAATLNCPILIDPLSKQRFRSSYAPFTYNYDHFLRQILTDKALIDPPKWIIRFGQFPVSKALLNYLNSLESPTLLISSYGDSLDPIHKAQQIFHTLPKKFCTDILKYSIKSGSQAWLEQWQTLEQVSEQSIQQSLNTAATHLFEGHIIHHLLKNIPDNSIIFSGNSMAIRDFDTFITQDSAKEKQLNFFANRGTSGIDGNISTFLGLLAHQKHYGVALLGDLTFYHDMNGLLIAKSLAASGYNATIIVVNNNGGGIFNYLPQQALNEFDKLWKTEINLDFQHTAQLYGLAYTKIDTKKQLESCLSNVFEQSGIQIIEVIIDQQMSVECHQHIYN